ncbi:MAG: hypothetical protein ACRDG8_14025 [Actinomycetota bacterium]
MRVARWLSALALIPALVAASDPAGDVRGCQRDHADGDPPDLVRAEGHIVELGTSAKWTLTFAGPLAVPDAAGHPFRVDIVLHDPEVPAHSFGYYRDVNRLVRVDATVEHPTEIYLLPERASNVFNPPIVEGARMTIQVPGRTLSDDEDLTGTSPGLEALRWTVIVRDESACDFLGMGQPTQRLVPQREAQVPQQRSSSERSVWWTLGGVAALMSIGAVSTYRILRVRSGR